MSDGDFNRAMHERVTAIQENIDCLDIIEAENVPEEAGATSTAEAMHRSMNVPPFAADLIGLMARQILSPDSSGTILPGYSRAVYLRSAAGELFWLAPGDVPMHRRGIRVQASLPRAPRDSAYRVADGALQLGSAVSIELGHARVWEPQRLARSAERSETEICSPDQLQTLPSPRGFGAFLPPSWSTPLERPSRPGRPEAIERLNSPTPRCAALPAHAASRTWQLS